MSTLSDSLQCIIIGSGCQPFTELSPIDNEELSLLVRPSSLCYTGFGCGFKRSRREDVFCQ